MDSIEKHYPPVIGEYAYYVTPIDHRGKNADNNFYHDELRWIVTINNNNKKQSVLCHWSSNTIQSSIPFQTCNGIIISVDKCLGK